ncbi:MAG: ABC transporter permease [Bacteroidota bacterium]|nr:ABC transporter permease [Bacteroidota bacterium]
MNKIWLVTQRELLTRIRKRSFIIMSLLGPVLIAGFFAMMAYFAGATEDTHVRKIAVYDSTGIFIKKIPDTQYLKFEYLSGVKLPDLKKILKTSNYYGILYISPAIAHNMSAVQLYSFDQPAMNIKQYISSVIEKEIRNQKLLAYHLENIDNILKSVETNVTVETVKLSESGDEKKTSTELSMGVAYISSFLIYMFILLFGVQVMRGVIEEKSNRIVEVIISSVKPFQLMMGKVLGVALTALIQFSIWIVLSIILISAVKAAFLPDVSAVSAAHPPQDLMATAGQVHQQAQQASPELTGIFSMLDSIDFYVMIGAFLFYFIGGFLLYSSMFAAVGAAVDNEADTQQFVMPITLPLIVGIMVMVSAFQNPSGPIAFWFSIIPLTSPIVMMARIPFGVPYGQIILSMGLLVATFIGSIWMAGKIYRTGILLYGKKVNYKEMIKWLRYKN